MVASVLLGRLPIGMASLALILLVRSLTGSYARAGAITGAYALAAAVLAPIQGRVMDRLGLARVLVPLALVHAACLIALVWAIVHQAPPLATLVLAAAAGGGQPNLSAAMRVMWPAVLGQGSVLHTAFAFESTAQEVLFIAGPILASTLSSAMSPVVPLGLCAACVVAGTLSFASAPPVRAWRGAPVPDRHWLGSLTSSGVRAMLLTAAFIACAFGIVEVGLTAFAEELGNRAASGVLLSLWGVGSITGGLVFGSRHWRGAVHTQYVATLSILACTFLLLTLPHTFPWMGAAIVVAGLGIAPWITCFYLLIDRLAPPGTQSESATWVSTGFASGIAMGRWLAGTIVEARGAHAALVGAGILMLAGLCAAWILRAHIATEAPHGAAYPDVVS